MLEKISLGMVLNEDLTGYDIKKRIESGIGVFYKASYGSLYPTLKRLAAKELLNMREVPQGGRQRIYYSITENGKTDFLEWLAAPMDLLDSSNIHLAKIYFYDKLPPDIRDRQLLEHEINCENYLKRLLALEKDFNKKANKDRFYYKLSTLYYGICVTRETIRWCRHIRTGKPLQELAEKGDA